jgi:pyruvate,orthophosphate dikinase
MYAVVVVGVDPALLDDELGRARGVAGVSSDGELDATQLLEVAGRFEALAQAIGGHDAIPDDPFEQLVRAVGAVFDSWQGAPARTYRLHHDIDESMGTAVNVQSMVYGNAGSTSASGVLFTRDPATGERGVFGEYLADAQGEDVVSGMRTPQPLREAARTASDQVTFEQAFPEQWRELEAVCTTLEQHYREVQDVEFTVERGTLFVLQTRRAKRTVLAELRTAIEMVDEQLIEPDDAVRRVPARELPKLLAPQVVDLDRLELAARGIAASPGAATGEVAVTAQDAVARAATGADVVLVRGETTASDIAGMLAARGIVTARGGATSHAAVVARGAGRPAVTGCTQLQVDEAAGVVRLGDGRELRAGDRITIDGTTGTVAIGTGTLEPARVDPRLARLLDWADARRTLVVRANADTGADAARAHELGAQGIGLCRTEHMVFDPDRLPHFTRAILATDPQERADALDAFAPQVQAEFEAMFAAMPGEPVTIRLLDPPLHEFLPGSREDAERIGAATGLDPVHLLRAAGALREANPMLGHRGVRLGITAPDIYRHQASVIARATASARARGIDARPQVMVPLVSEPRELREIRAVIEAGLDVGMGDGPRAGETPEVPIPIGAMLETPRACVLADRIAAHADFVSFGTNDLTQLTWGISRDDAGSFLGRYREEHVVDHDPFGQVDVDAVGALVAMAVERVRAVAPDIEVGVCGEHGGDPASIAFFASAGVDYVSCSPPRVPGARLAAAQAALAQEVERENGREVARPAAPATPVPMA